MLALPIFAAALAAAPLADRAPAPPAAPDATTLLASLSAGEPTVAEVADAAARAADRETDRVDGFAARARLSTLLPRLTAEYRQDERSYRIVGLQGSGEVD